MKYQTKITVKHTNQTKPNNTMTKENIKISQEINFNGLPTWVSIGASLQPEDNVLDCLKILQKDITDYRDTAAKEYSQSKWAKEPIIQIGKEPVKLDPDETIIAQYKKAVLDENEAKVTLMETIYNTEKLKDAIKE